MNSIKDLDNAYGKEDLLGNGNPKSRKKLFIILGIVGGIALIIAIILMAVLIPRPKNQDTKKTLQKIFFQ